MPKRFLRLFFAVFLALTALFAGTIYVVDPYYHYHGPVAGLPLWLQDGRYQNVGAAENLDYDYLLMGTSVTANFTLEPFQQRLPGQTRKLIVQGGYFEDFLLPLDVALETHTVRQVFWGVDSNCWRRYDKENTWEAPTYLFDESLYNDVHYLLSKDTFFWYIPDILRAPSPGEFGPCSGPGGCPSPDHVYLLPAAVQYPFLGYDHSGRGAGGDAHHA